VSPLSALAGELGLADREVAAWGPGVAKVLPGAAFSDEPTTAPLVLVSAISATPAGVGKTTVTIGLTQAARLLGVRAVCALRQPSLGPVFGKKGGGAGGGRSRLVPEERINLHLTGDLHAIGAAHNLLAALADNALYFGGPPALDPREVVLRRALDGNDRFLRQTIIGLGGRANGIPREDGFDITAASEVMAILCLARDYADLKKRLGDMLVGFSSEARPVLARDLRAEGAMAALLRDALLPNLVATSEGAPALVHGGPFGNIAHGCNSLVATRLAMRRAEVVFTEAGFGFDLGAEKFLDIKCRVGGIWPRLVVLVASLRALKFHGGATAPERPDPDALREGLANLDKHVENVRAFGLEPVIALNVYDGDSEAELAQALEALRERGVQTGAVDVFRKGGSGARELTEQILARARGAAPRPTFLYDLKDPPAEKIRRVARTIYGAASVEFTPDAQRQLDRIAALGYGDLPVCIAKTHLSLSDDARRVGRPRDFVMTVREVRLSAGAGFIVPITGEIVTMPGLPKVPRAQQIDLLPDGTIVGVGDPHHDR
jgi:formate--tetrahydrofolate ligase